MCWVRSRFKTNPPLTLVTGANSRHFKSLLQLLSSIGEHEPDSPVVVHDLGLHRLERAELVARFPQHRLLKFKFKRYPKHVNIRSNRGQYAWKPIIVWRALTRAAGPVCWMDAGNVLTERLDGIREGLRRHGFYSAKSRGTITDWTHPGMLDYLGVTQEWASGKRNLTGACVAFDPRLLPALRLAKSWRDEALIEDCIAPPGSSRENHRQDQALLTVLAYKAGFAAAIHSNRLGFVTHQDIDKGWRRRVRDLESRYRASLRDSVSGAISPSQRS